LASGYASASRPIDNPARAGSNRSVRRRSHHDLSRPTSKEKSSKRIVAIESTTSSLNFRCISADAITGRGNQRMTSSGPRPPDATNSPTLAPRGLSKWTPVGSPCKFSWDPTFCPVTPTSAWCAPTTTRRPCHMPRVVLNRALDRRPELTKIIRPMGERLPFMPDRTDKQHHRDGERLPALCGTNDRHQASALRWAHHTPSALEIDYLQLEADATGVRFSLEKRTKQQLLRRVRTLTCCIC
jgi:hypothetical protein